MTKFSSFSNWKDELGIKNIKNGMGMGQTIMSLILDVLSWRC